MCGIAGVVAWDDRFRVSRETLLGMSARIAHRGPDADAVWINRENQSTNNPHDHRAFCGLAFRRLSILDLDPRAMQPMTDGQNWLVFNGEIYNFRELKTELDHLRPGHPWKTTGDSEVILRAFDYWGEKCVEHFNGMFAIALWNPRDQSLFLARDPMGQKPLYYALAPGGAAIAFASELSALMPVDWIDKNLDSCNLIEYLSRGYIPRGSIYQHINSLSPGCVASFPQPAVQRRYFDPNAIPIPRSNRNRTRDLVQEAVKRQLVSDVPIGCFLSGGIDSSIIAAAMKQAAPKDQKVLTFSIGFDDPRYDETKYAAAVAKHIGTEHRQFIVKPDAASDLPKLAATFAEPFGDSSALPTHYLARETRTYVKVALSGDGGDELFGGYDRYRAVALASRLDKIPAISAILGSRHLQSLAHTHPKSRRARAKRFLQSLPLSASKRYAGYVQIFDDEMLENLLSQDLRSHRPLCQFPSLAQEYEHYQKERDPIQSALALDRVTYLPGDLLTKVDRASMLHALEVRSPFMDPEAVTHAAGLRTEDLFQGGPKRLLREAFQKDLPGFVFRRKKMGFAVPIGDWLRTSLRGIFNDLLFASDSFASAHLNIAAIRRMIDEHQLSSVDHSQRIYALLMLELWRKQGGSQ